MSDSLTSISFIFLETSNDRKGALLSTRPQIARLLCVLGGNDEKISNIDGFSFIVGVY